MTWDYAQGKQLLVQLISRELSDAKKMLQDEWYWGAIGQFVVPVVEQIREIVMAGIDERDRTIHFSDIVSRLDELHNHIRAQMLDDEGYAAATVKMIRDKVAKLALGEAPTWLAPNTGFKGRALILVLKPSQWAARIFLLALMGILPVIADAPYWEVLVLIQVFVMALVLFWRVPVRMECLKNKVNIHFLFGRTLVINKSVFDLVDNQTGRFTNSHISSTIGLLMYRDHYTSM